MAVYHSTKNFTRFLLNFNPCIIKTKNNKINNLANTNHFYYYMNRGESYTPAPWNT